MLYFYYSRKKFCVCRAVHHNMKFNKHQSRKIDKDHIFQYSNIKYCCRFFEKYENMKKYFVDYKCEILEMTRGR